MPKRPDDENFYPEDKPLSPEEALDKLHVILSRGASARLNPAPLDHDGLKDSIQRVALKEELKKYGMQTVTLPSGEIVDVMNTIKDAADGMAACSFSSLTIPMHMPKVQKALDALETVRIQMDKKIKTATGDDKAPLKLEVPMVVGHFTDILEEALIHLKERQQEIGRA